VFFTFGGDLVLTRRIQKNGKVVAYRTEATNLFTGDVNNFADIVLTTVNQ